MSLCTIALERIIVKPSLEDFEIGNEGLIEDIWKKIKKFFKDLWVWLKEKWYQALEFFGIRKNIKQEMTTIDTTVKKIEDLDKKALGVVNTTSKQNVSNNTSTKNTDIDVSKDPLTDATTVSNAQQKKKPIDIHELLGKHKTLANRALFDIVINYKGPAIEHPLIYLDYDTCVSFYKNISEEGMDISNGQILLAKDLLKIPYSEYYIRNIPADELRDKIASEFNFFKYSKTSKIEYLVENKIDTTYMRESDKKFYKQLKNLHVLENLNYGNLDVLKNRYNTVKLNNFEDIKQYYRSNVANIAKFDKLCNINWDLNNSNINDTYKMMNVLDDSIEKIIKYTRSNNPNTEYSDTREMTRGYENLIGSIITNLCTTLLNNALVAVRQVSLVCGRIVNDIKRLRSIISSVYNKMKSYLSTY